ncbi:unnamed protein product [Tetraodon nigroviridis]|uniref:(spotted green pufferfish) hypothetical protein n=1 Tax=Tetraodon nigroviridis TaxID=99883 RepID=Q4T932_TETNG|nr:unnamed protein product [Tetraodon nigroviridis]
MKLSILILVSTDCKCFCNQQRENQSSISNHLKNKRKEERGTQRDHCQCTRTDQKMITGHSLIGSGP